MISVGLSLLFGIHPSNKKYVNGNVYFSVHFGGFILSKSRFLPQFFSGYIFSKTPLHHKIRVNPHFAHGVKGELLAS